MEDFNFKKKFGQNFLTDKNLLNAIVNDAGVNEKSVVVEVGMGQGALTEQLVKKAKLVSGYEIDNELIDFLNDKFSTQKNLILNFCDILSESIEEVEKKVGNDYMVVANIPYYITTPIIFHFLENSNCKKLCLMIQKEVAEKIVAKEKTANYGVLSVICQSFCSCNISRIVSKKMFRPMPKVDSAVIVLTVDEKYDKKFAKFIKSCFSMRRKTLVNNLSQGYNISKQDIGDFLTENNIVQTARAEELTVEKFKQLFFAFTTKFDWISRFFLHKHKVFFI